MPVDPVALEALRRLMDLAGRERIVVIGATVPMVLIDLRQGLPGGRTTHDIDVALRAGTWEEFADITERMVAAGFRRRDAPHAFAYESAEIDVIPYNPALAPAGRLEWPGQDRAMSILGLEEAFASARDEPIGDVVVPMASVPGCVLLKCVAYRDRPPERARDLLDIMHCLEHYAEDPENRRYEVGEVDVDGRPVLYGEAGAYLLGQDVASLARPASLEVVRTVIDAIEDEYAEPIQQILCERNQLASAEDQRPRLFRMIRVFAVGLGATP